MNDHAFISSFRKKKILQLSLFIILEFFFLLFLALYLINSGNIPKAPMLIIAACILAIFFVLNIVFLVFDLKQLQRISGFSKQWEQMAYIDKSGIHNRYSLDLLFQSYSTPESLENVGCCLFTIKNLEEINQKAGREAGDEVIKDFCNILDERHNTTTNYHSHEET